MRSHQATIETRTQGRGFTDVTEAIARVVAESGVKTGLCTVFLRHTSASLVIQENADPAVLRDLARWIADIAPEGDRWEHDAEGPDDMPAHVRTALTTVNLSIPIARGQLCLGTWQGIYVWEHRHAAHGRRVTITVQGETRDADG